MTLGILRRLSVIGSGVLLKRYYFLCLASASPYSFSVHLPTYYACFFLLWLHLFCYLLRWVFLGTPFSALARRNLWVRCHHLVFIFSIFKVSFIILLNLLQPRLLHLYLDYLRAHYVFQVLSVPLVVNCRWTCHLLILCHCFRFLLCLFLGRHLHAV